MCGIEQEHHQQVSQHSAVATMKYTTEMTIRNQGGSPSRITSSWSSLVLWKSRWELLQNRPRLQPLRMLRKNSSLWKSMFDILTNCWTANVRTKAPPPPQCRALITQDVDLSSSLCNEQIKKVKFWLSVYWLTVI